MSKFKIKFDTIDEVRQFVKITAGYSGEIDVCCGSYTVDGKSFLGILSCGLKRELEMNVHDEVCGNLFEMISFCIA